MEPFRDKKEDWFENYFFLRWIGNIIQLDHLFLNNFHYSFRLIGSNEESGAQTTIYCALEESITKLSGGYFDNCCLAKESKLAQDPGLAKKLWEVSCQATGIEDWFEPMIWWLWI